LTGLILNIERGATNDGPGLRTVVFMKGCPLSCLWCHNPESQSFSPEPFTTENGVETRGTEMTVDEVMDIVLKDIAYYNQSGGGLTVSGGEPLAHLDFVTELLRRAMEKGIHTAIETSGYASTDELLSLVPYVDLFLYDFKESDDERHLQTVSVSRKQILTNLIALDNAGADIILRCPIIPNYNERPDHFSAIAHTANILHNISEIQVMPYHPMGASKARAIGRAYEIDSPFPTEEQIEQWIACIKNETFVPVKRG